MNDVRARFKFLSLLLCFLTVCSLFASCGGEGEEVSGTLMSADSQLTDDERPEANVTFDSVDPSPEEEPPLINPLTGLGAGYDVANSRPAGVMLNNITEALPQVGIGDADIIFECLAEGGVTRLFALFSEYHDLGVIGSVRSARPYYLDFAQMFDAIYVHAGGSEDAYSDIWSRGIDNIDGVRGDPLGIYYRDPTRMQTMAIEHTLMTTGGGITETVEYCGFRTSLRDGFSYPFKFSEWGEEHSPGGEECRHIRIPFSMYQTVDYEYDGAKGEYLRYQYNGAPHIDGGTGEQLSFKNVIVIFCNTYAYDDYGRLRVDTAGSGDGYLATAGTYIPIVWSRGSIDGNVAFTRADDGELITLNRGKTFINVCPTYIFYDVGMNIG